LFFNPKTQTCDWPNNVDCPLPSDEYPSVCDSPTGLFPHKQSCEKYFHCKDGAAVLRTCPANLHFNPHNFTCDWPENANCQLMPKTSTFKPTQPAHPIKPTGPVTGDPAVCEEATGIYQNPNDCHTYYHCTHGIAYYVTCPANLHFNKKLQVCDYPQNAGCIKQ